MSDGVVWTFDKFSRVRLEDLRSRSADAKGQATKCATHVAGALSFTSHYSPLSDRTGQDFIESYLKEPDNEQELDSTAEVICNITSSIVSLPKWLPSDIAKVLP